MDSENQLLQQIDDMEMHVCSLMRLKDTRYACTQTDETVLTKPQDVTQADETVLTEPQVVSEPTVGVPNAIEPVSPFPADFLSNFTLLSANGDESPMYDPRSPMYRPCHYSADRDMKTRIDRHLRRSKHYAAKAHKEAKRAAKLLSKTIFDF